MFQKERDPFSCSWENVAHGWFKISVSTRRNVVAVIFCKYFSSWLLNVLKYA